MKPNTLLLLALGLGVVLLSMRRRESSGMGAEGEARLARELAQIPTTPPPGPGVVINGGHPGTHPGLGTALPGEFSQLVGVMTAAQNNLNQA